MKKLAWLAVACLMAGCGANPLLKMAAADYAPFRIGSEWNYVGPSGAPSYSSKVLASSKFGDVDVFSISNYSGVSGTSLVAASGAIVQILSPISQTDRKLPYVTGNSWELASSSGNVTVIRKVDGYENIDVPAGPFYQCFRLKTEISTFSGGLTTTTGTFIWVAPNVGDVQFASINAAGVSVITDRLGSYSLGQ